MVVGYFFFLDNNDDQRLALTVVVIGMHALQFALYCYLEISRVSQKVMKKVKGIHKSVLRSHGLVPRGPLQWHHNPHHPRAQQSYKDSNGTTWSVNTSHLRADQLIFRETDVPSSGSSSH